jgi:hypothetical protein
MQTPLRRAEPDAEVSYTDPASQLLDELRTKMGLTREPEQSPEEVEEAYNNFFKSKAL